MASEAAREQAIETLLDLDPNSPFFRLKKILTDGPKLLDQERPNHISDAALLDVAHSLADYEISSPSHKEFFPHASMRSEGKKNITSKNDVQSHATDDIKTIRSRIMRHHYRHLASKTGVNDKKDHPSSSDTVSSNVTDSREDMGAMSPPVSISQLITMLRMVYEPQNIEHSPSESTDVHLSSIMEQVKNHRLFSSKLRESEKAPIASTIKSSVVLDSATSTSGVPADSHCNTSEMNDLVHTEAIVGDACLLHSLQLGEGCDDINALEVVTGYLIAASSIFSSCYARSEIGAEVTMLQVAGVLSLIPENFLYQADENLSIDSNLLLKVKNAINLFEGQLENALKDKNPDYYSSVPLEPSPVDGLTPVEAGINKGESYNCALSVASSSHASPTGEEMPHDDSASDGGSNYDHSSEHYEATGRNSGGQARIILSARSAFEEDEEMDDGEEDHDEDDQEDDEDFGDEYYDEEPDGDDFDEMYEDEIDDDEDNVTADQEADSISDRPSSFHLNDAVTDGSLSINPANSVPAVSDDVQCLFESKLVPCDDSNAVDAYTQSFSVKQQPPEPTMVTRLRIDSHADDELRPVTMPVFEKIASSHILSHLLHVTSNVLDKILEKVTTSSDSPCARCFGGVASDLFPPSVSGALSGCSEITVNTNNLTSEILACHLLVALIYFLTDKRCVIMLEIEQMIHDLGTSFESVGTMTDTHVIDETDDPATGYGDILGYISADESLSTSKAYEEKGLLRKAAAARSSTSTMVRENIRRKIYVLCGHLQNWSISLTSALKCLRKLMLLRSSECLLSKVRTKKSSIFTTTEMTEQDSFISPMARIKLLSSISQLTSSDSLLHSGYFRTKLSDFSNEYLSLSKIDSSRVILFQEGIQLWGECVPLLYPTQKELKDQFDHLIRITANFHPFLEASSVQSGLLPEQLDKLVQLENVEKLQVMCWRLRRSDLLALMVPMPFRNSEQIDVNTKLRFGQYSDDPTTFDRTSSYICALRRASTSVGNFSCLSNLVRLYRALCHRVICNWILWDSSLQPNDSKSEGNLHSQDTELNQSIRLVHGASINFDSTKCPDSISLTTFDACQENSAVQTANKIWGTVLSGQGYNSRSGTYRWAVRLDQCDRGHIFVGVATSEASMKTYIGGDKHGWGLIGTRALWHDRRKIRTDYGKLFRSGTTIVVTLDTDAGTVRFGSLDNIICGDAAYSYTDWGIAFENLPVDTRFFPAVGLYQREDRVTFMTVVTAPLHNPFLLTRDKRRLLERTFYPPESTGDDVDSRYRNTLRCWNASLCCHSITFVMDMLSMAFNNLSSEENAGIEGTNILMYELPAVAASLSLFPVHIPYLSGSIALEVLPLLVKCCKLISDRLTVVSHNPFPTIIPLRKGKWLIRYTTRVESLPQGGKCVELDVCFRPCSKSAVDENNAFEGCGIGTNGETSNDNISIAGIVHGTQIHIIYAVEECIYFSKAELNLDGTMFQGALSNDSGQDLGKIAGIFVHDLVSPVHEENHISMICVYARLSTLLSNTFKRLCHILNHTIDFNEIHPLAQSSLLSDGLLSSNSSTILEEMYRFTLLNNHRSLCDISRESLSVHQNFSKLIAKNSRYSSRSISSTLLHDNVRALDSTLVRIAGGIGSLRSLSPVEYDSTRLYIITSIFHLKRKDPQTLLVNNADDDIQSVWLMALHVIENSIRKALSVSESQNYRVVCRSQCAMLLSISRFLLEINPPSAIISKDLEHFYSYLSASGPNDLNNLMHSVKKLEVHYAFKAFSLMAVDDLLQLGHHSSIFAEHALVTLIAILGPGRYMCQAGSSHLQYEKDSFTGTHYTIQLTIQMLLSSVIGHLSLIIPSLDVKDFKRIDLYSLTMTYLTVFFVNWRSPDIVSIVGEGHTFWVWLKSLLECCKNNLDWNRPIGGSSHIRDALDASSKRLIASNLMRCSIFALNCIFMHFNACGSLASMLSIPIPIDILKAEMTAMVEEISLKEFDRQYDGIRAAVMRDFKQINGISIANISEADDKDKITDEETATRSMLPLSSESYFIRMTLQRLTRNSFSREMFTCSVDLIGAYVKLLVDTCSFVLFTSSTRTIERFEISWVHSLLNRVFASEGINAIVPNALSLRILRLCRIILPNLDADTSLISDVFNYLGLNHVSFLASNSNTNAIEEAHVYHLLVEAISLLRMLYGISNRSWRCAINSLLERRKDIKNSVVIGGLAFLGGLPGRLTTGSWILLRSKAALSSISTISRRFGASVLTSSSPVSPKIIASGFEGVINSLHRHDIPAGIVTSFDTYIGSCHVVLMDPYYSFEVGKIDDRPYPECVGARMVCVSEADILLAEEYPLVLDTDFPLEILIDFPSDLSSEGGFRKLLLILRSYATVLTHKSIAERLYNTIPPDLSSPFFKVLEIANDQFISTHFPRLESIKHDSLSSLPAYEARYWMIQGMLLEVNRRKRSTILNARFGCFPESVHSRLDDNDVNPLSMLDSDRSEDMNIAITHKVDNPSYQSSSNAPLQQNREEENESSGDDDDIDDSVQVDDDTAFDHLREVVILQMAELGLPRSWSEYSLRRIGGISIEAAVHFCLEHAGEMERLIVEDQARSGHVVESRIFSGRDTASAGGRTTSYNNLVQQLADMGFPRHWCEEALTNTSNDLDAALTWILNNGERLSSLDDGNEEMDGDRDGEGSVVSMNLDTSRHAETTQDAVDSSPDGRKLVPLFEISGKCSINQQTLEVSGLPNSGFSSVGTKGILLTKGKWYYEVLLVTAGCIQVGWADSTFSGHCNSDRGDGCGDGPSSWAYDGWRKYLWHKNAAPWGCQWQEGDIVGCLLDMDSKVMSFTLNGCGDDIGMGIAFCGDGLRYAGGLYACVSFNRKERLKMFFGGCFGKCKYIPPVGYNYVSEAILARNSEWIDLADDDLVQLELYDKSFPSDASRLLCDRSGEEQGQELFQWQHRFCTDVCVQIHTKGEKELDRGEKKTARKRITCEDCLTELVVESASKSQGLSANNASPLRRLQQRYDVIMDNLLDDYVNATLVLSHIYARKLILQLTALMSNDFDIKLFCPIKCGENTFEDYKKTAILFWCVIEKCCSLYNQGWSGETSVMVMTTEHLNIGVIGLDHRECSTRPHTNLNFICIDEKTNYIPSCAMSSILNTVRSSIKANAKELSSEAACLDSPTSYPACFEMAAIGDTGCFIIFLRAALQNAVIKSHFLMQILLRVIRRSMLFLLNNLNERTDEIEALSLTEKKTVSTTMDSRDCFTVDSRLLSFFTGLLLNDFVWENLRRKNEADPSISKVYINLFESWSIGLLSPSLALRTISAWIVTAILQRFPKATATITPKFPSLQCFYEDLASKVARRIWIERSAAPVFSHYLQALLELLSAVRRSATSTCYLPSVIEPKIDVDASTPIPLNPLHGPKESIKEEVSQNLSFWEWDEGWVGSCDDVWLGSVEYFAVDWTPPCPTAVRSLVDSGEGPPFLREGCTVIRSLDWGLTGSGATGDEDGKNAYDQEKEEREQERKAIEEGRLQDTIDDVDGKKTRNQPVLPTGRVISVESWNGEAGSARRVQWNRTGLIGLYRFGGDGGRFDICHVETNKKGTRITKRYVLPETAEQTATRNGFGSPKKYHVILRLRKHTTSNDFDIDRQGILEWPDFGAAVLVDCHFHQDSAVTITEKRLIFGSNDSGWEARFGIPNYQPGTVIVLSRLSDSKQNDRGYEELLGSSSYVVDKLRNKKDGGRLRVSFEMRMIRGTSVMLGSPCFLPPIRFDSTYHAQSIGISLDGMTATCHSIDGRGIAYASVGFCKGIHYWEVKIEHAETGSIFIGVAEKYCDKSSSLSASAIDVETPRLNKWCGWGFVNFRASYNAGVERIYGAHVHTGDTVGVLLDCDSGRLSFFVDSVKYGEHILNDLGCAFENLSPFGFTDGYGSGGAGRGASKATDSSRNGRFAAFGTVRPQALWPVIGLKHVGDRVTFSGKWMTSYGVDGATMLKNACILDDSLLYYNTSDSGDSDLLIGDCNDKNCKSLPRDFLNDAFQEYKMWLDDRWYRTDTRGSGSAKVAFNNLSIDIDRMPLACAIACANIGLNFVLLPNDRVRVKRSAGRVLELPEDALVLGAYRGHLWYRLISQKSDGGSLSEGGNRAWFWNESEVVNDSLSPIGTLRAGNITLPMLQRFRCVAPGGIKIVYAGGAVMRTDIEIFDGSMTLGVIPVDVRIPKTDVIECRLNSCGVLRYRVRYSPIGEGWISDRIRGGKEDQIVESVQSLDQCEAMSMDYEITPEACAQIWFRSYEGYLSKTIAAADNSQFTITHISEFEDLLHQCARSKMSPLELDSLLSTVLTAIAEKSDGQVLNISFEEIKSIVVEACSVDDEIMMTAETKSVPIKLLWKILAKAECPVPSPHALIARMSLIRALNRRALYALPLISLPSPQETSSILGGSTGFGAMIDINDSVLLKQDEFWFRSSASLAMRLRNCRTLLFADLKNSFINSLIEVTTSHTPLSHDEYEFPRDIRTVRVNRVKANAALTSSDKTMIKKNSVFFQLYNEMKSWSGTALRRSFIAKGHGGQKRAFKVKLLGEGVNDYSGPYREVFTDSIKEVFLSDENGYGYLGLTVRSSNAHNEVGEERNLSLLAGDDAYNNDRMQLIKSLVSPEERLLLDHFCSYIGLHNESLREKGEYIFFLGLLCGMALRHKIQLDLPFPLGTFWKRLCAEVTDKEECLKEIDYLCWRRLKDTVNTADGSLPPLPSVLQQRMLNSFSQGLSIVIPSEVFSIFTGEELRTLFCGKDAIDVKLLKSVTEYEGFDENSEAIQNFWDVLEYMSEDERKLFIQFVWSRSRLPSKKSDFETCFKIQKGDSEDSLPSASTCFFTLTLPSYKDKATLKEKLLFAIHNVTTMESDYITNDSEVGEGWRGV